MTQARPQDAAQNSAQAAAQDASQDAPTNRAVIFANGVVETLEAVRQILQAGDTLIAADGGLRLLRALGLTPDVRIGDLDSLPEGSLPLLQNLPVQVVRHPPEKNETDLELALQWAVERGFRSVRIVAALGGRVDHTLANLFLLTAPDLGECDVRIDDGIQEIFVISDTHRIQGLPGDLVSLLPLRDDAHGVTTENLYYPLHGETLKAHQTRGISNVMTGNEAHVSLTGGMLLCVHTRSEGLKNQGEKDQHRERREKSPHRTRRSQRENKK